jgi:hypothetical protein
VCAGHEMLPGVGGGQSRGEAPDSSHPHIVGSRPPTAPGAGERQLSATLARPRRHAAHRSLVASLVGGVLAAERGGAKLPPRVS